MRAREVPKTVPKPVRLPVGSQGGQWDSLGSKWIQMGSQFDPIQLQFDPTWVKLRPKWAQYIFTNSRSTAQADVMLSISEFAQGLVGRHTTFFQIPEVRSQAKTVLLTTPEPLGPQNGHSGVPGSWWSVRQGPMGLFWRYPDAQNVGP